MSFPKECPYCGADKDNLVGWNENDYIKTWECKKCGKKWDREFNMNGKNYYQMLENVHFIVNRTDIDQINFWKGESYKKNEFNENGLSLEWLLEKNLCKGENQEAYDSDTVTQINGEKRAIAKNILRNHPSISVQDVAEITLLPLEQVIKLEREVRKK